MNEIYDTYRPDGFGTISSYLMVNNPEELVDFLKTIFYAVELHRSINEETNKISNIILKIGTSCFMISPANDEMKTISSFYLYVNDVDFMHKRAIDSGLCKVVFEPSNKPYEDRQSGIIDPSGNYWWISKRLVEKDYE